MFENTHPASTPSALPTISVIVPVRNERHRLSGLIAAIEAQKLQPIEVLLADGRSDDGTLEWLQEAARDRPWLRVVENPDRCIPHGLNRAVALARGEIVARMDAHAYYDSDYLWQVATVLAARPEVVGVGGAMATSGSGPWGRAIAAVLRRRLGLGGARHRIGGAGGPIDHVFSGAYRRQALLAIGGFDPAFHANEDFEVDHRLSRAGGTIWLEPRARCVWFTRESVPALATQMWRYGFFKARTLRLHPRSMRPRQLAPPAVVLGLAALTVARPGMGAAGWLAYLASAIGLGAWAGRAERASAWRAGLVTPVIHLAWGCGLLVGLVRHWNARGHVRDRRTLLAEPPSTAVLSRLEDGK
jgi:succinoglycan biosynthesis protein ExoA